MRKALYITALSAALSTMAFAEDWTGKLIDAHCNDTKEQTKVATCDASSATTAFALDVNGKVYKLDTTGNSKATAAIKNRADRSSDPAKAMSGPITAKVTGTGKNGEIMVDTVEAQ